MKKHLLTFLAVIFLCVISQAHCSQASSAMTQAEVKMKMHYGRYKAWLDEQHAIESANAAYKQLVDSYYGKLFANKHANENLTTSATQKKIANGAADNNLQLVLMGKAKALAKIHINSKATMMFEIN